jgi:hypothetical protein
MADDNLFGGPDSSDTVSSVPAEAEERIQGSDLPDGSASSPLAASEFEYNDGIEEALDNKVETWNDRFEDPDERNDEVTDNMVRAVFRRGMGAFSDSHNPQASRRSWGMGRVNEFLERAANLDEGAGFDVDPEYQQDDDLLPRGIAESTLTDDEVPGSNGPDLR